VTVERIQGWIRHCGEPRFLPSGGILAMSDLERGVHRFEGAQSTSRP
jgi:hypothetical protein